MASQQNVIIVRTRFSEHYGMSINRFQSRLVTKVLLLLLAFTSLLKRDGVSQVSSNPPDAVALYGRIGSAGLNPSDVHAIREVSIEREDLHVSLSDGTIAFMHAIDGKITGAVFEGVGEVLLIPPDRAERTSVALFTGSAILEQQFTSAYFRFVDDRLVQELRTGFRPPESPEDFVARWNQPVRELARIDGLAVLQALTNSGESASEFIHMRLGGTALGVFDVYVNTAAQEQISVGQASTADNTTYYNIWTSFVMRSLRHTHDSGAGLRPRFELLDYSIESEVEPPSELNSEADVTLVPQLAGQRTFILELSQQLTLKAVQANGRPLDFIQNQAVTGSELSRRGDDLIAIVFPTPLRKDERVRLHFKYAGPVMFEAGGDLLYVGARGTWYPNAGPSFSNYELTFSYPEEWSLVATGRQLASDVKNRQRITRFVTDKPISRAGFNLGKFNASESAVSGVKIHAYAAKNVEQSLQAREARTGRRPDPAREVNKIAAQAAEAVQFLSRQLDPFPYSHLEITQLPGPLSQSWPGLIYLSSLAFLDADERRGAGVRDPYLEFLVSKLMLVHETGHQWWGDAVDWSSYRDQWIIEALANYCALLMLEKTDPASMKLALDYYKGELLRDTRYGPLANAGPVTLGVRLVSSKFPNAYDPILYGRGTWLIHMLRTMLREASGRHDDSLFFSALRSLLAQSPNQKISTVELQSAFEKLLPATVRYEGAHKLDWFFDSWVNGASVPQFVLDSVRIAPAGPTVKVSGVIRQSNGAKDLVTAIPMYAVDEEDGMHFLGFVFADDAVTRFTLKAPHGTKQVLMDPEHTVLRR
jgi:hypothetical protein